MAGISVPMLKERETKNTVRYAEIPQDSRAPEELVIGTLYVPKATLRQLTADKSLPESIRVQVEAV